MKIIMEEKDYKGIIRDMEQCTGMTLNKRFINRLLKREPRIYGLIYGGFSSELEETLMDTIGQELAGESWPTYSDGRIAMRQFDKKLHAGAKKNKIQIKE